MSAIENTVKAKLILKDSKEIEVKKLVAIKVVCGDKVLTKMTTDFSDPENIKVKKESKHEWIVVLPIKDGQLTFNDRISSLLPYSIQLNMGIEIDHVCIDDIREEIDNSADLKLGQITKTITTVIVFNASKYKEKVYSVVEDSKIHTYFWI